MKPKQMTYLIVGLLSVSSSLLSASNHPWRDTVECKDSQYSIYFSASNEAATVKGPKDASTAFLKCHLSEGGSHSYYCFEKDVADAGYYLSFTPMSGIPYTAKLSEITFAGAKPISQFPCYFPQ